MFSEDASGEVSARLLRQEREWWGVLGYFSLKRRLNRRIFSREEFRCFVMVAAEVARRVNPKPVLVLPEMVGCCWSLPCIMPVGSSGWRRRNLPGSC